MRNELNEFFSRMPGLAFGDIRGNGHSRSAPMSDKTKLFFIGESLGKVINQFGNRHALLPDKQILEVLCWFQTFFIHVGRAGSPFFARHYTERHK